MKRNVTILCLLAMLSFAAAETSVSGVIIGETWDAAGSPYVLTGDLTIYDLIIEPGVEVIGNEEYTFLVHGQLHAQGSYQAPITFGPSDPNGTWSGITFFDVGLQSTLNYCLIEKTGNAGISYNTGPEIILMHTTIRECQGNGIDIGDDAFAVIRNCIIEDNVGYGINNFGAISMHNTILANNGLDGIYNNGEAEIYNSNLVFNQGYAINNDENSGLYHLTIMNSIVYFNNDDETQLDGYNYQVTYSNVQNGFAGIGNLLYNPLFSNFDDFTLTSISPCIDSGSPDSDHEDYCIPPSYGTARNDIGAYGGPSGCGWLEMAYGCMDPEACNYHPGANMDDGSCAYNDCNEDCGGTAVIDDCGDCVLGLTGLEFNWALDDCGVCYGQNADKDCAGVCFGLAYFDLCGVCDDIPENDDLSCQGCTDQMAINYDPDALFDDGSCEYQQIFLEFAEEEAVPGDTLEYPLAISIPSLLPIHSVTMEIICPDSGIVINDVAIGGTPDDANWIIEYNMDNCPVSVWMAGSAPLSGDFELLTLELIVTEIDSTANIPIDFNLVQFDETYYSIYVNSGGVDVLMPYYGDASVNGIVTAFDAGLVLQYVVGETEFGLQAGINAEVSGDETISALDASYILQYGVGLITEFPIQSGLLIPPAAGDFSIENQPIAPGELIELPIYLENGSDIYAFEFNLEYNPDQLTFAGLDPGLNIDDFVVNHFSSPEELVIAGASAYPDGEQGVFLLVQFEVQENFNASTTQIAINRVRLNENVPQMDISSAILYYPELALGDLNQDNTMDILDIVTSVSIILDLMPSNDYQLWAGDLNEDGTLDILDIVTMVSEILN